MYVCVVFLRQPPGLRGPCMWCVVPLDSEAAAWAACRGEARGSENVSARSQEAGASASKKQSWHRVWAVPESLLKERERGGGDILGGNIPSRAPGAGISAGWNKDGTEASSTGVGLGALDLGSGSSCSRAVLLLEQVRLQSGPQPLH